MSGTVGSICRSRHEVESEVSCRSGDLQLDMRVMLSLACIGHQCTCPEPDCHPLSGEGWEGKGPWTWLLGLGGSSLLHSQAPFADL